MEMWLKQLTLVFLTVAVAAMVISGQDPVTIDEKPGAVTVPYGSPLNLKCNLSTAGYERFLVNWYFNPSGPSLHDAHNLSMMHSFAKNPELVFPYTSSATDKNSGWYFCKVTTEIPIYKILTSNGTEVIVTKSVENTTHPSLPVVTGEQDNFQMIDWWLWLILAAIAVILIVLLVICLLLRGRCHRTPAVEPIYSNTRPVANKQPSPRPGMVNLKTCSSSQNLRNPSPSRTHNKGKQRYKS